jgi:hypothetical protein
MSASVRFASISSCAAGAEIGAFRSKRIRGTGCMCMPMGMSMCIGHPAGCCPGMALRPGCEERR